MNIISRIYNHTRTVLTHKWWVARYCFMLGLYRQGVTHDLSKFSPAEFLEGVRYYEATRSPIAACRERSGYSRAWFHHRGNNPHHAEMWIDDFDHGGRLLPMPYRYAAEKLCDHIAACRTYSANAGRQFSYRAVYEWWMSKKLYSFSMHSSTFNFVTEMLRALVALEREGKPIKSKFNKVFAYTTYKQCRERFKEDEYIRTIHKQPDPKAFR